MRYYVQFRSPVAAHARSVVRVVCPVQSRVVDNSSRASVQLRAQSHGVRSACLTLRASSSRKFDAFLASSSLYGDAKTFHFDYARTLTKQAEKGVEDLVRLARLDVKLHREQKVVRAMQVGIEQSLINGDPITGLLFLHEKLCAAAETDDSVA